MKLIVAITTLLILACTVLGDDVRITKLYGLATGKSLFDIRPGDALNAHNVDLSSGGVGTISLRYGTDSVSYIQGQDSIVELIPFETSDGERRLIVVTDSAGVGYGNVYITNNNSHNISLDSVTRIATNWPVISAPTATKRDDWLYMGNGSSRGVVWDRSVSRPYPLAAPGHPIITPLTDSGGVDGDVRYLITFWRGVIQDTVCYRYVYDTACYSVEYDTVSWECGEWDWDAKPFNLCIDSYLVTGLGSLDSVRGRSPFVQVTVTPSSTDCDSIVITLTDSTLIDPSSGIVCDQMVIESDSTQKQRKQGLVTDPVMVDNGRVLFSGFTYPPRDRQFPTPDSVAAGLSRVTGIAIYRSKANASPLGVEDTFFFCAAKQVQHKPYGSSIPYAPIVFDTLTMIDSISDAQLNWDTVNFPPIPWSNAIPIVRGDSSAYTPMYGSPGYYTSDYTVTNSPYGTAARDTNLVGYSFAYTLFDSTRQWESPLSPGATIIRWGNEHHHSITLPRSRPSDSGLVYRVYMAPMYGRFDSVAFQKYLWTVYDGTAPVGQYEYEHPDCWLPSHWCEKKPNGIGYRKTGDSVVLGAYYRISTVTPSRTADIIFKDTINTYDSLIYRDMYEHRFIPPITDKFFFFANNLLSIYRWRVRWSEDSTGRWDLGNFIDVYPDDGDPITGAWTTRTTGKMTKNNSSYNLVPSGKNEYRLEFADNIGSIAPRSSLHTPFGTYYLSRRGFEIENDGAYLERTFATASVSQGIDNIRDLSVDLRRKAVTGYIPTEQKVLLCIGDTTYVWDELSEGWSTWGMQFRAWALYDTTTTAITGRGDRFYFARPGSSALCLYRPNDSVYSDWVWPGFRVAIPFYWESGPLFIDPANWKWQVERLGLFVHNSSSTSFIYATVLNELDQQIGKVDAVEYGLPGRTRPGAIAGVSEDAGILFDSLDQRYRIKWHMHDPAWYVRIRLNASNSEIGRTIVDGLVMQATRREQTK